MDPGDDALRHELLQPHRGRPSRERIFAQLEAGVTELRSKMGGLPSPDEADGIWGDIWRQEAHNSTALEGNTLALREVDVLLGLGKAVGGKTLREYLEVRGYADAAEWTYRQARQPDEQYSGIVSLQEVRELHHRLVTPVWNVSPPDGFTPDEGPGAFRRHEIAPLASGLRPLSWTDVHAQMTDWLEHAQRLTACQPLERLTAIADLHAEFERIHPFLDGNGRAGRLVTNLLLVRLGYPPAVIYRTQRDRYITCLGRADAGDPGPLAELLARSATDTLHRFIMPAVAGPYRQVPLAALADEDVTARALRNAAERGRLKATRGADGQWRSSRRAATEYKRSRYRRAGPPPTDLSGWKGLARSIGEPPSSAGKVLPGLVEVLSPRHRRMLQLSFGLTPTRREDVAATARRFGITEARANHIVAEGLVILRERMEYRRLAATSGLPRPP